MFGASAGVHALDRALLIGPDICGATSVSDGNKAFAKETTPVELMVGAHYLVSKNVRIGLGARGSSRTESTRVA